MAALWGIGWYLYQKLSVSEQNGAPHQNDRETNAGNIWNHWLCVFLSYSLYWLAVGFVHYSDKHAFRSLISLSMKEDCRRAGRRHKMPHCARGREIIAHSSSGRDKLDCPLWVWGCEASHWVLCCVSSFQQKKKKKNLKHLCAQSQLQDLRIADGTRCMLITCGKHGEAAGTSQYGWAASQRLYVEQR